jgi:HlyD family secretion protein
MNAPLPTDLATQLQGLAAGAASPEKKPAYDRYLKIGYLGVAGLVLGLFGWAAFSPIKGAVIAPGFVAVDGKPAIIQHLDGGIVGEILVRDGAKVAAGDPLIRLNPTETDANREIVEVQLNETRARVERLKAERDGQDDISFPTDLLTAAASQPRVERAVSGQQKLFVARRDALRGNIAQLSERVRQANDQIQGSRALIQANRDQIEKLEQERVAKQRLVEQGYLARPAVFVLEREQLRLRGDIASRLSEIDRLQGLISETRKQIDQLERDRQAEVLTELRQAELEASGFREQLTAALAQAERVTITAPVSGTVHNLAITTTGGVIQPGLELMQIIPSDADLVVFTQVNPQDVDQVFLGQDVRVRLSAFNARTTPELYATVSRIAPDRIVDPTTGFPYYEVQVDIPPDQLARLNDRQELIPGMPAESFMQTESRTVLNYLLKPATDAMQRAGREE